MRVALKPHPDTPSEAVTRIEVEIDRSRSGGLTLHYSVCGTIADLLLPRPAAARRADDLWQHTCFEAFVRAGSGAGYLEFNFAPSSQWAAYAFTNYREGRSNADVKAPIVDSSAGADRYDLRATLDLPADKRAELGLSAVIEERNGRKSYWALAHPMGDPDFHHSDCFALQLPPAI